MAIVDIDLACTSAALVRDDFPNNNYHGAEKYRLDGSGYTSGGAVLLLTFEELPEAYRYRNIYSATLYLTINRNISLTDRNPSLFWGTLESGFDAASVTWNTMPDRAASFYNGTSSTDGTGDETISITAHIETSQLDGPAAGYTALKAPAIRVHCSAHLYGSSFLDVYTNAAASGKRPYLRVSLRDTNASVSVDEQPVNGMQGTYAKYNRFACNKESVFSWDLHLTSGYAYADVVQDSATLGWRKIGETAWNTVSISGSEQSYTFPANALPAADIEWYVVPICGDFNMIASPDYSQYAYPRIFVELAMVQAGRTSTLYPDNVLEWDIRSYGTNPVSHWTRSGSGVQEDLYFIFDSMGGQNRFHAIEAAGIRHRHIVNAGWKSSPYVYTLESPFDAQTLTWNSAPPETDKVGYVTVDNSGGSAGLALEIVDPGTRMLFPNEAAGGYLENNVVVGDARGISYASRKLLTSPALKMAAPLGYFDAKQYSGSVAAYPAPVLLVMLFDDMVTSTVEGVTPTAGWINRHEAQTFRWEHVPVGDYACAAIWESASATLYWSQDGGSTWNSVAAPANSNSLILPADTLPAGTVQWYVTATDDQGTTSTSPIYTITTADSETTATPIVPIQTVEDGQAPITFRWSTANDHGTLPTGADLQISSDGLTWTALGSVTGSETAYTAAAETLPGGTVYWRVRAYNADGVAGAWSETVSFVAINAPPRPIVSVEAVPFAVISWQSDGQQAYRVTVDGVTYGPFFGSDKSFTLPDYLENGGHTATVELQGSAGLWSKPGTATFSVLNIPGAPIALSGTFYRDAALRWSTDDETADFLVYRDGVRIAHSSAMRFTDRTVLGGHSWQVINRLPGGYYTASNAVQGELRSCGTAIALLEGGDWLELKKNDSESAEESVSVSQQLSLRHFEGAVYPVAEVSPYIDQSGSYTVAWTYAEQDEAAVFEAMLGRPVILKARGSMCMVGIMSGYALRLPHFYRSYGFTVQRIHWGDFIDEDD